MQRIILPLPEDGLADELNVEVLRGCRDTELDGRLPHTAALGDGEEDMQIAHFEPTTNLAFPVNLPEH